MKISGGITGFEEIDQVLANLPAQLSKSVLQGTFKEAAKPLLEEAKRLVPVHEGDLQDSLGIVSGKKSGVEDVAVYVGPRYNKRHGFIGAFIEYGTSKKAAHPFMRPAYDKTIGPVKEIIKTALAKVLLRYMRRTIKKNK
jgi:HK97 gp10 family phage protein